MLIMPRAYREAGQRAKPRHRTGRQGDSGDRLFAGNKSITALQCAVIVCQRLSWALAKIGRGIVASAIHLLAACAGNCCLISNYGAPSAAL
jgi:hypothetical protein